MIEFPQILAEINTQCAVKISFMIGTYTDSKEVCVDIIEPFSCYDYPFRFYLQLLYNRSVDKKNYNIFDWMLVQVSGCWFSSSAKGLHWFNL